MPFCDPSLIKIPPDRFRPADAEEVANMVQSMKEVGQLHPIVVNNNDEKLLRMGLHRTMACKKLEREVWYTTEEEGQLVLNNPLLVRMAEYQENFRRKEFTPIERSKAIAEIDRLMREIYGSKGAHKGATEGWTQEMTAKKIGQKSQRAVSEAIAIDNAVKAGVPNIDKAKTMQEATKMVKDFVKIEAAKELARRNANLDGDVEIANPLQHFGDRIILGDCLAKIKELPNNICSMFITDPPFGIELDQIIADRGETISKTRGVYSDREQVILDLIKDLVPEMARVGKPSCHVVMFCGVQFWHLVREWMEEAGFKVHKKPLIWVKASTLPFSLMTGRTANPSLTPGSSYEAMVYAWRGDATIARQGLSDVFVFPTVSSGEKCHVAQKPIALLEEIISRFYHPSTNPLLIDPFCGSGSTLIAARRLGIKQYFGYELSEENRERAIAHMVNTYMKEVTCEDVSNTTIDISEYE